MTAIPADFPKGFPHPLVLPAEGVYLHVQHLDFLGGVPPVEVFGDASGKVLVLGWGSTYGSITSAVERMREEGKSVSSAHLRHLNPFPKNHGEVLSNFETVNIPEMNLGQLCTMIRAKYLIDAVAFSKVKGRPFQIREIVRKVEEYL